MSTQATPAQIAFAAKLRDDCALYATWAITDATIFGLRRKSWEILGYANPAEYRDAGGSKLVDAHMGADDSLNGTQRFQLENRMIREDAERRAAEMRTRQAELGAADIEAMDRTQISAFIDAAKAVMH